MISPGPSDDGYPQLSTSWYVVGTLTIAWTLAYLDRTITTLLTPALKADLLLSDTEISIVQGLAFSLFFAVAALPLGRLVDRSNRRNIIIVGVLCWSVMTFACGLASTYWELVAARVGVGIGEACLAPASLSILADYLRPDRRGRAIGIVTSGAALGTAGSNILGGLILNALGNDGSAMLPYVGETATWRIVFFIFAIPGLAIALLMLTIREPERRENRPDIAASFMPFLKQNAGIFVPIYLACGLNALVSLGLTVWGPQVFIRNHGMTPGDTGVVLGTIQLVAGSIAGIASGLLSDAMKRRHPIDGRLRALLYIAPFAVISVALFAITDSPLLNYIGYGGIKITYVMIAAAAYAALQELAPNDMRGQAIAMQSLVVNIIGMGAGPALIALTTDYVFRDEKMVAWSIVAVCLPAMLLCWLLSVFVIRALRKKAASAL